MSDLKTKHEDTDKIDLGIEVTDNGGYSSDLPGAFRDERTQMDIKEKNAGTRFHDSGERIPGRQKGKNDRYTDRPSTIYPLGPGR